MAFQVCCGGLREAGALLLWLPSCLLQVMGCDVSCVCPSERVLLPCCVLLLQVVPTAEVTPPQTNGWKVTVAGILLVLLVASSVQLSLVANITKLPKVRPHTPVALLRGTAVE